MNIQSRLATRARGKAPATIRELFKYLKIDGMISLGGGYPNPDTFVFDKINIEFKNGRSVTIEKDQVVRAAQYGPSDGHAGLINQLVKWQEFKDGAALDVSQFVVLNGSQEGLFIMAYLFLDVDDFIAVSEPTFPGALSAFQSFCKNFIPVPLDSNGMNMEILERKLSERKSNGERLPKFIYVIPNGHNPGGVALSQQRREHLIRIANEFDLLVLEDDPYQLVKLEDTPALQTLQSLDTENRVIRLDSFSKIFAPGLRIGYASGPPEIIRQFVLFKQASNLHTSMFIQEVLLQFLVETGFSEFQRHIRGNCQLYRTNRDAMVSAAQKYLPKEVTFNIPGEGMFIWFQMPEKCNAQRMIDEYAGDLKVLLVPGSAFSTQNGLQNCMRASFSLVTPEQIMEGMRRFGEMIILELR
ncbi:aminotransferase class I/II-fold pyridoxal phosphate-dependent enzyme [candidate division KSB1 bacterium]|nr:aminotransferase class I/II-fold pyridoxal phosphate-dependent enzyme [candidate division KSB1 bacterium]